jgi:hypothetical protein
VLPAQKTTHRVILKEKEIYFLKPSKMCYHSMVEGQEGDKIDREHMLTHEFRLTA